MMTTSELSAQSIFDGAVRRVATMPMMAAMIRPNGPPRCMYRSPNGPCLVGMYLTDDEVRPARGIDYVEGIDYNTGYEVMEHADSLDNIADSTVRALAKRNLLPDRLVPFVLLLGKLQGIHDNRFHWRDGGTGPALREEMRLKFMDLASSLALDPTVVDEVWPAA